MSTRLKQYWCDCGAEPEIGTGNKVRYCPICGKQTLHKKRNVKEKGISMVTSYARGHSIEYLNNVWVYSDNKMPIDHEIRSCPRCGKMPTKEGYDSCLGFIEGVSSVCCGHGSENPYVVRIGQEI